MPKSDADTRSTIRAPKPLKSAPKKTMKKAAGGQAAGAGERSSAQEAFLDELIRDHTRVSIFLVNGVKLEGEIKSYDRYVIIMRNAVSDKIYKHAVSTVMPAGAPPATSDVIIERRVTRSPGVRRTVITRGSRDGNT